MGLGRALAPATDVCPKYFPWLSHAVCKASQRCRQQLETVQRVTVPRTCMRTHASLSLQSVTKKSTWRWTRWKAKAAAAGREPFANCKRLKEEEVLSALHKSRDWQSVQWRKKKKQQQLKQQQQFVEQIKSKSGWQFAAKTKCKDSTECDCQSCEVNNFQRTPIAKTFPNTKDPKKRVR